MRMKHAAVMAGLIAGLFSGAAQAAYMFTLTETSQGVLQTGSGSLDIDGLVPYKSAAASAQVDPSMTTITGGSSASGRDNNVDLYFALFTSGAPFGTGANSNADSGSGSTVGFNVFGMFGAGVIAVPTGYTSGNSLIPSTALYAGQTFSSLGLTQGTQTYGYTGFPSFEALAFRSDQIDLEPQIIDSFTVRVGTVPLPASAPMFGAALLALGAVGYGMKRKRAATAA